MQDFDDDIEINPKDVSPDEITGRLLQLDALVPAPIYNEKTIPKQNYETLFADDFSGSSGNLEQDNNSVNMLRSATGNEAMVNQEEAPIEEVEKTSIMEDLEFENPVQPQPMVQGAPATGQINPRQYAALFPGDFSGQAIAEKDVQS